MAMTMAMTQAQTSAMTVSPAEAIDYEVSPPFVALLEKLAFSLVISNYQSSTVMTFSALGNGRPVQMFAPFHERTIDTLVEVSTSESG